MGGCDRLCIRNFHKMIQVSRKNTCDDMLSIYLEKYWQTRAVFLHESGNKNFAQWGFSEQICDNWKILHMCACHTYRTVYIWYAKCAPLLLYILVYCTPVNLLYSIYCTLDMCRLFLPVDGARSRAEEKTVDESTDAASR